MSTKKGVVYTSTTGNYDELYNHTYINPNWDYVCFTDDISIANKNNSAWQIRPLEFGELNAKKNHKWHKFFPHKIFPEYKYSLWVDANVNIINPDVFNDIQEQIKIDRILAIAPHPERVCAYDELKACIDQQKDDVKTMQKQMNGFKKQGFPKNFGLFETNIMFRSHHDTDLQKVMQEWWDIIVSGSSRDQLSLTFLLWKNNFSAYPLTDNSYRNEDGRVEFWPHLVDLRRHVIEQQKEIINIKHLVQENTELILQMDTLKAEISNYNIQLKTIKSATFYTLWQTFNKLKKILK